LISDCRRGGFPLNQEVREKERECWREELFSIIIAIKVKESRGRETAYGNLNRGEVKSRNLT